MLVDFRHLEVGNVVIQASGSGMLSFNGGESPEEALNENIKSFEQKAIPRYKLQHTVQEIKLPEYALRYLKISCDKSCIITSIRHDAKIWPVEFQMQFTSDNVSLIIFGTPVLPLCTPPCTTSIWTGLNVIICRGRWMP